MLQGRPRPIVIIPACLQASFDRRIAPGIIPAPCPNCPKSKSPARASPTASAARASPPCASASRLRWPLGCERARRSSGRRVGEVTRRGKYLWLALERGGLLLHLGMSGSLSFGRRPRDARAARPLRPRHRARHPAPDRSAPLRRGRLVAGARERGAGGQAARRARRRAVRSALRRRAPARRAAPAPGRGQARRCSAARSSSAPATSTPARRCSRPASIRARAATASAGRAPSASPRRCGRRSARARRARRLDPAQLPRRARHGRRVPARGAASTAAPASPACAAATPIRRIVQGAAGDVLLPGCQRR